MLALAIFCLQEAYNKTLITFKVISIASLCFKSQEISSFSIGITVHKRWAGH